jgi:hypothetical protein
VLEAEAGRRERAWLDTLTYEELEAHIAAFPLDDELEAAIQALSEEELELALAGNLSEEDYRRWYREREAGQG